MDLNLCCDRQLYLNTFFHAANVRTKNVGNCDNIYSELEMFPMLKSD